MRLSPKAYKDSSTLAFKKLVRSFTYYTPGRRLGKWDLKKSLLIAKIPEVI
ncbi:hypothetical protein H2277_02335 [Campylobacter sp. W0014]|uniref:hypothetical protein n=1 Tax=Campylobacter sp. W0014 TaxID=2735781 RepID=UPI001EC32454|nr:hypothetical protein [Campylobacter sp. W0014]